MRLHSVSLKRLSCVRKYFSLGKQFLVRRLFARSKYHIYIIIKEYQTSENSLPSSWCHLTAVYTVYKLNSPYCFYSGRWVVGRIRWPHYATASTPGIRAETVYVPPRHQSAILNPTLLLYSHYKDSLFYNFYFIV